MLKTIKIKNFRSLKDFQMEFNSGLNVIIGENDAGKTSLIDSLKIIFGLKKIDINDFNQLAEPVIIELEEKDFYYYLESKIVENILENTFQLKPSEEKIAEIKSKLEEIGEEEREQLKEYCSIFNVSYRSTTKIETIKSNLTEALESGEYITVKNINYPISFLGSREFENINSFFENTFFKELKEEIWNIKINDKTLNQHIADYIEEYKNEQLTNQDANELNAQLKEFLPDFKEINPIINPTAKLNLDINVEILNNANQEIMIEKMGDGTNRRTTMAIFKHKKDKKDLVYVFDEIETHLHIKAQLDILKLLKDLSKQGKQIIITTHSPFLINQVNLNEIKLMSLDAETGSRVISLDSSDESQMALTNLGINNIDLFFTNKLLIVEGESEEYFVPVMYEKIYGYPISQNFIKIVKADGIKDIPNFIRIIKKSFAKTNIFVLMDNDADIFTKEKIDRFIEKDLIHKDNIFVIGDVEFEDTFSDEILIQSLSQYMSDVIGYGVEASVRDIQKARNSEKFSEALGETFENRTFKNFRKPIFAQYLAMFSEKEDIDEKFIKLFELINE